MDAHSDVGNRLILAAGQHGLEFAAAVMSGRTAARP